MLIGTGENNKNGTTSYKRSQLTPLKAILFFKKKTKYNLIFLIVSDHISKKEEISKSQISSNLFSRKC